MKDHYRIREISQLYGIGPDSLRYYEEIGILSPKRGENGYRQYGMRDIYRLNVIKDLRQLGFSMRRIKEYLDDKNVASTLSLLREEESVVRDEIRKLRAKRATIRSRFGEIRSYAAIRAGEIAVVSYPDRRRARLNTELVDNEEIDFALNRLHRRFGHQAYTFGSYMIGASMDLGDIRGGVFGLFRSVFFILEEDDADCDSVIPGGDYVSLHYRGDYVQSAEQTRRMVEFADRSGFALADEILELYKIDVHESSDSTEFLTEIQARIESAPPETDKAP
jgi:DNA-binding transcriptional MerR regulator